METIENDVLYTSANRTCFSFGPFFTVFVLFPNIGDCADATLSKALWTKKKAYINNLTEVLITHVCCPCVFLLYSVSPTVFLFALCVLRATMHLQNEMCQKATYFLWCLLYLSSHSEQSHRNSCLLCHVLNFKFYFHESLENLYKSPM